MKKLNFIIIFVFSILLLNAGGNPSGIDSSFAHKVSIVYNPKNDTMYMFYDAVDDTGKTGKGRGIGLITSKPISIPPN